MTACVAGRRNGEHVVIELDCILPFMICSTGARGAIVSVHDSFAAKLLSEQLMICDVIAVR